MEEEAEEEEEEDVKGAAVFVVVVDSGVGVVVKWICVLDAIVVEEEEDDVAGTNVGAGGRARVTVELHQIGGDTAVLVGVVELGDEGGEVVVVVLGAVRVIQVVMVDEVGVLEPEDVCKKGEVLDELVMVIG